MTQYFLAYFFYRTNLEVHNISVIHKLVKDTVKPLLIFQSKKAMTKQHHISLDSQFTVVLNSIICFSVGFWDNSVLMLKVRFFSGLFFRKRKGKQLFQ